MLIEVTRLEFWKELVISYSIEEEGDNMFNLNILTCVLIGFIFIYK